MTGNELSASPVVADGSALHYALLFASPRVRDIQTAMLELAFELGRAARSPNTPEVAYTRLNWWGEELARLMNATPRHPLTKRLSALCAWTCADSDILEQMLTGARNEIGIGRIETDEQLALHCFRNDGCAMALGVSKSFGSNSVEELVLAGIWLGRGIRLTEIVRRFNLDLIDGRILIPQAVFQSSGASLPIGPTVPVDENVRPALVEILNRSDEHLARARQLWLGRPMEKMIPYWVALGLYEALNQKIRERLKTLPPEQIRLSQAVMLWRAWRCARSAQGLIKTNDGDLS